MCRGEGVEGRREAGSGGRRRQKENGAGSAHLGQLIGVLLPDGGKFVIEDRDEAPDDAGQLRSLTQLNFHPIEHRLPL